MKRHIYSTSFILLISSITCKSLAQDDLMRIIQGEKVPDYKLANLVNYPTKTAKISDFKVKLLILDYWFTGCKPCIESWSKLMKLQKQFDDKIQIMLVNHMEDEGTVRRFIDRKNKKSGFSFNIPSVTGDEILHKAMPPLGYPTIVWIDREGIYRATTAGNELNESNINAFLTGDEIQMAIKSAQLSTFDSRLPLYLKGNGGDWKNMLWYSTVSKYDDKAKLGYQFYVNKNDSEQAYSITSTRKPIIDHIRYLFNPNGPYLNADLNKTPRIVFSRIYLKVKDPRGLTEYTVNNCYNYQLRSSQPCSINKLKEMAQVDMQRYFSLKIEWQKMKKKCLILRAADTSILSKKVDKYYTLKGSDEPRWMIVPSYEGSDERDIVFENVTPEYLISTMSNDKAYFRSPYPLIDKTGYKEK